METIGYFASLIIGISLGLIGGGGSILTVPVLVYLFGVEPVLATAYSLFIVGSTSLIGAFPKYRKGLINLKASVVFGLPAIAAVFLTRMYIVPVIPENLFTISGVLITKAVLMMVVFAMLMVVASITMIRSATDEIDDNARSEAPEHAVTYNYPLILAEGAIVGILTGLVGAGGGFLIIPALVLLSRLPMKEAVGTSLLIIAAKSLIGFIADVSHYTLDWRMLIVITIIAIVGIFAGNWLHDRVSAVRLKRGFGWFILIMGCYIIARELFLTP